MKNALPKRTHVFLSPLELILRLNRYSHNKKTLHSLVGNGIIVDYTFVKSKH